LRVDSEDGQFIVVIYIVNQFVPSEAVGDQLEVESEACILAKENIIKLILKKK
jgi:hypothetical protein